MKNDTKETKLADLEFNNSEYVFVYSDKFNIFFFLWDREDNKLYKITTDKYFTIEYIDDIIIPTDFYTFKDLKFFKPFNQNSGQYNFLGLAIFNNVSYKFKIDDNNSLIRLEDTQYHANEGIINSLTCLKSVDIFSYIQKKNKIFLIGYDSAYNDYIYTTVNIADNMLEKTYSFSTDYGDIIPTSINIDADAGKTYIVGKFVTYDDSNNIVSVKPFLEAFL